LISGCSRNQRSSNDDQDATSAEPETIALTAAFQLDERQRPREWLGFANNTSKQDRELELHKIVPDFKRIDVPGDDYRFSRLCQQVHKRCLEVKDWQGATKSCDEISQRKEDGKPLRDGSRIALCIAR